MINQIISVRFNSLIPREIIRRRVLCRLSESSDELWRATYAPGVNTKYNGIAYIDFDIIETHLRFPDRKGDTLIGEQVGGNFTDLIFQDPDEPNFINQGDMNFWFSTPEGGWRQGIARYYFLEAIDIQNANWPKLPKIMNGSLRRPLEDFHVGDTIDGISESVHLHHGVCIDFGCNFSGILPLNETMWEKIYTEQPYERFAEIRPDLDRIQPGKNLTVFKCKIVRILNYKCFRWPIELEVIEPTWLMDYLFHPFEPKLLVLANQLSRIDDCTYARISGRPFGSPRRYACRFSDPAENLSWMKAQIEHTPEDHSQDLLQPDISSITESFDKKKSDIIQSYDDGNIHGIDDHLSLGSVS